MEMRLQEFAEATERDDFAVGDSFWIGDWEFEVVNTKAPGKAVWGEEVVFRWELTRQEFVQVMADNHPEIKDPEGFFDKHKDEIIHRFQKGFDALVGECGATYGTVMNDAVDEAVGEREGSPADRLEGGKGQGPTIARGDGEEGSQPSPSYSNICKEVNEKMKFDMQSKLDEYMRLLEQIKQKTTDERTAVALLQEVSKDRRSAEIREERETKNGNEKNSQPATEKQKQFMKKLGIKFPATVTKQEASMLIDEERGRNSE
jgi:hypothetical protein